MNEKSQGQMGMMTYQIRKLVSIYRDIVRHFGITENEFWIWYTLIATCGEYSQQDICEIWAFSKQTVNSIISHMVKDDYAALEAVPGTRNRKNIQLTDKGRKFGENIIVPVADAEMRALERIPLKERMACIAVLAKYVKLLKEEIHGTES